jgi:hypothetical protein
MAAGPSIELSMMRTPASGPVVEDMVTSCCGI